MKILGPWSSYIIKPFQLHLATACLHSHNTRFSLMEACYYGQLECAKLLVENGGSWLTRDHSGFSALHYAVDGGHVNVVSYILSEGVPVSYTV